MVDYKKDNLGYNFEDLMNYKVDYSYYYNPDCSLDY